jgi:hypothetical protein
MTPTSTFLARALCAALLALAWALVPALAGCASAPPEQWLEDEITASSDRVLWDVTILALQKSGFPLGASLEPGKLDATSGWMISLAPFRGKGFREQCEVRYTPQGPRTYKVAVRVRREKNDDLLHPLDLTYAEWEPEPDNQDRAQIVMQYIRSLLGTTPGAKKSRSIPH